MPEQFGLEQIFRNGRAVDRHKSLVSPVARIVQTLRQQFLAGSARAEQHHRRIGIGHALHHLCNLQHFRRSGDDLAQYMFLTIILGGKSGIFLFQPVNMKGPADDQPQFVNIHRLLIKVPGTTGNGPQGTGFFAMTGSDDDLGVRLQTQDRVHGGETFGGAIRVRWQTEVQCHHIRFFRPQQFNSGLAVACDQNFEIVISPFQLLLQTGIVFHDQQLVLPGLIFLRHHAALSSDGISCAKCLASGSSSVNRLPTPSVLSTSSRPFMARASSRAS